MSENKENMTMDDHEILMRLAKQQKTAALHRRIIAYVEVLILILLVAMGIAIAHTRKMKQYQSRVFELKEKLEEEQKHR